jgi:N-acetylmuramoyl-L-alanine amidase
MSYTTRNIFHRSGLAGLFLLSSVLFCACRAEDTVEKSSDPNFVLIQQLAEKNGFKEIEVSDEEITLRSDWTTLQFQKYSRKAMFNGSTIWLNASTSVLNGKWAIAKTDHEKTILPILRPYDHLAPFGYKTIVLDPGHGGKDSGGVGPAKLFEKNIALAICKALKTDLQKLGYIVHLTRDDDRFIELEERCAIAKRLNADLFLSIHCNAGSSKHAEGIETYSLSIPNYPSTNDAGRRKSNGNENIGNKNDQANVALGHAVQRSIVSKSGRADRGLRRARFVVLRDAPCPATLVECGFLSNDTEAQLLQNKKYMMKIANALAVGVDDYIGQVRKARLIAADTE